ncbi:transcription termination/antitermination NusG family protein [Pseudomonas helleri]|uniref:transcription termination/antitermination NusG family protein n=1 Tax=Pseudomonas helleri TaxID=1608996 RepID=UPI003FCF74AA
MADSHWYALFHDSNYHKSLVSNIQSLGGVDEVFSPERITLQPRRGRPSPKKYKVQLFPGYLFVRFDWEQTHPSAITAFSGAYRLVRFGDGDPMVVPDDVIDKIKAALLEREKELSSKRPVVIGADAVKNSIAFLVEESSSAARSAGFYALLQHEYSSEKARKKTALILTY